MSFSCPNCSGSTCDYCNHLGFVDFNLIEDEEYFALSASGKVKIERSPHWSTTRINFIKDNNKCVICSTQEKLQVHHKLPFHIHRELELEKSNLMTLCRTHHFCFGHLLCWNSYNPKIDEWVEFIKNRP